MIWSPPGRSDGDSFDLRAAMQRTRAMATFGHLRGSGGSVWIVQVRNAVYVALGRVGQLMP